MIYMKEIVLKVAEKIGRGIVTEEEVKRVCRRVLFEFGMCPYEAIEEICRALLKEPVILSTFYSDRLEINGVTYYSIHGANLKKEEIEEAYRECVKSRRFLDVLEIMEKIVDNFFYDYSVREGVVREYTGRKKYGVFFTLLEDLYGDIHTHAKFACQYNGEYAVAVPTESTPNPFIRFFKQYSELVNFSGIKVWVIDVERESIDPFIGYPRDPNLLSRFRNPRLATKVESLWRVNVKEVD